METKVVKEITYRQPGEQPSKAVIARCPVDLTSFSGKELSLIKYLCEAVDMMNILYWDLTDRNISIISSIVKKMLHYSNLKENEKNSIEDYRDVLLIQNSLISEIPRKNHLLEIPKERAIEIMSLKRKRIKF